MTGHAQITCLNVAGHVIDHALITWLSCTNDVPQEALIKELSRQESHGSAGKYQADEHAGITQLSWQLSSR